MSEENDDSILCSSCGKSEFEYVDITWVGTKDVFLYRHGIEIDPDFDACKTEVYHDCSETMFIECMACSSTYNIANDEHGMEQLLSVDVTKLMIKDQPALKKAEIAMLEAKLNNKTRELEYLTSNIKILKEEEKALQTRVKTGRIATEGVDLKKISRIIKRGSQP